MHSRSQSLSIPAIKTNFLIAVLLFFASVNSIYFDAAGRARNSLLNDNAALVAHTEDEFRETWRGD
jgi:hypothetical protein